MTNKKKVEEIKKFIETNFTHYRVEEIKPVGRDKISYAVHGTQLFVGECKTNEFIKSLLGGSMKAAKFWKSLLK